MEGPTGVFNLDGITDMVCQYISNDVTWPAPGDDCGPVELPGELNDGTAIVGSDTACIAGEDTCNSSTPIPVGG